MTDKDKALNLALEVLEDMPGFRADIDNAITAIKQARSAGRPLAPLVAIEGNAGRYVIDALTPPAAQRQWVGLTDEQFQAIRSRLSRQDGWDGDGWDLALKEAIEAKLKEKNGG
jgi:hypothetical protein